MMETFIVLGLCFILYEALDFFQGCMHSAQPTASDQIDAYRRQLDEQRQQQQQEQFLANFTPLLTPSTTASLLNELRQQQQQQLLQGLQAFSRNSSLSNKSNPTSHSSRSSGNSTTTTTNNNDNNNIHNNNNNNSIQSIRSTQLNGAAGGSNNFAVVPSTISELGAAFHSSDYSHATASLPRDYYYLQQHHQLQQQQQQQHFKTKSVAKSLLSKLTSISDNRIFPREAAARAVAESGVITTQPTLSSSDCTPPGLPAESLVLDLKRATLSNNCSGSSKLTDSPRKIVSNNINQLLQNISEKEQKKQEQQQQQLATANLPVLVNNKETAKEETNPNTYVDDGGGDDVDDEDETADGLISNSSDTSSLVSSSASSGSATLASCTDYEDNNAVAISQNEEDDDNDDNYNEAKQYVGVAGCADYREIECERLRRKCVNVKRIYSISEKF